MKKKIVWMLLSCLMALSLMMASCGPAAEEEKEVEIGEAEVEVEEVEEEEAEEEVVEEEGLLPPEVPKHGGTLTLVGGDPPGFDPAYTKSFFMDTAFITHEGLLGHNWAKGPAGTGETDWQFGSNGRISLLTGLLAESWEMPDDETLLFHIRKGVHFWDKYPANGRELTAYDVLWNMEREWGSRYAHPPTSMPPEEHPTSFKALDKYTFELKVPSYVQGLHISLSGELVRMIPPEVIEEYGDQKDWKNVLGTGPWILTDYVPASFMTFEKNPNYWREDPIHQENKWPYPDELKTLIIPDLSTIQAAFRTGKLDMITNVSVEDWERFMENNPDLKYQKTWARLSIPCFRCDKPELPYYDVRVRQAANLAVNQREILEDYYKGYGEIMGYPFNSSKDHAPMYTPLEEMSEVVQELFEYKPDKARQLLAEAGYPEGFKTKIDCATGHVDLLSIIREYLLAVGIDMEIQPHEIGTFTSIQKGRTHEEMVIQMDFPHYTYKMHNVRRESASGTAFFEHERTRAAYTEVSKWVGRDDAKAAQAQKEITPFILEQCWGIWVPVPYRYTMWWPWVQNYQGEINLGSGPGAQYRMYIWVDEALKKSMGY